MSGTPQQITESEEDPASMQVLPLCNYDSLRKHKHKSERTGSIKSNSSCHFKTYNEQCTRSQTRNSGGCSTSNENIVIHNATETELKTPNDSTLYKGASTLRSNSIASSIELNTCKNAPNRTCGELSCDQHPPMTHNDDNIKLLTTSTGGEKLLPYDSDDIECSNDDNCLLNSDCCSSSSLNKTKHRRLTSGKRKSTSSENSETIQMSNMYKNNNCLAVKTKSRPSSTSTISSVDDNNSDGSRFRREHNKHGDEPLRHSTIVANDSGIDEGGVTPVAL